MSVHPRHAVPRRSRTWRGPIGAVPSETETVISQLARTVFDGRGSLYLAVIAATTLILVMAANTAFADFPRLARAAGRGRLPPAAARPIAAAGSCTRAASWCWRVVACVLIIVFDASVTALIPLYAIGVFLSFTLSQAGMTRRWWKIGRLPPGRRSASAARRCATTRAGA